MRWAVGFAAVGFLVVLAAGAGAAPRENVPGANFVGGDGELFGLVSNSNWRVDGVRARVTRPIRAAIPTSSLPDEHEALQTIWAQTCLQGRQVVHFKRRVFVAGPLWKLSAYVGGAEPHPGVFKSFEVLINGRSVLKTNGGGGGFERTAAKGDAVQWGDNLFEVIAVKKAFPHGYTCTKGGTRRTGINFVFRGDFGNDLSLPTPAKEEYVPGGRAYRLQFSVAVRNNGPGGLAQGLLLIHLIAPQGELSGVSQLTLPSASPPLLGCTERQDGREYDRRITCRLANFRRGETIAPTFAFQGNSPFPVPDVRVTVESFVNGGYQIGNGFDNGKTDVVVFCAPNSTNPKCPR